MKTIPKKNLYREYIGKYNTKEIIAVHMTNKKTCDTQEKEKRIQKKINRCKIKFLQRFFYTLKIKSKKRIELLDIFASLI